jgi:hypothetical protein
MSTAHQPVIGQRSLSLYRLYNLAVLADPYPLPQQDVTLGGKRFPAGNRSSRSWAQPIAILSGFHNQIDLILRVTTANILHSGPAPTTALALRWAALKRTSLSTHCSGEFLS